MSQIKHFIGTLQQKEMKQKSLTGLALQFVLRPLDFLTFDGAIMHISTSCADLDTSAFAADGTTS